MKNITGKIEHNLLNTLSWVLDNNDACIEDKDTLIFAIIYSAPKNFKQREFVRNSWGNKQYFDTVKMRYVYKSK